ncbi:MAG: metalloregulator ArsR/SmtB family transcription factor [Sedimentisphaerales bacterium]|nr:metalloregulator ArsR/SmtB family transcription factor [Sedimentisphaerales bacterium]
MDKEVELLKVLSEPIRLRLAVLLAVEGEVCVCQLSAALQEPEYKVSRHLGLMRAAGLVEARRDGTWMYYQLAKPACALQSHLCEFFQHGFDRHPMIKADRKQLKRAGCGK